MEENREQNTKIIPLVPGARHVECSLVELFLTDLKMINDMKKNHAEIWTKGTTIFGSEEKWIERLGTTIIALGNKKPSHVLQGK